MGAPAEPCNCNALRRAERSIARHYQRAFAPFDLTIDQFAAMAKLHRLGPASIVELGERLVMDRAMLAYVLKGLGARHLVEVARAERDARCRIVSLTEAGTDLFLAAKARWADANAQVDAALGDSAPALRQLLKDVEGLDLRLDMDAFAPSEAPARAAEAAFL